MKRRINLWLCLTGAITLVLTAALTLGVYYQLFLNQVFYDLKTDGIILAESYELLDQPSELVRYKSSGFRITVIAPDGSVEYDTNADADGMDNHSNRPEVEPVSYTHLDVYKRQGEGWREHCPCRADRRRQDDSHQSHQPVL